MKKLILGVIGIFLLGVVGVVAYVMVLNAQLPQMISVQDYEPLLVSEVYDRGGNKIGEFASEKRILTPYNEIPKVVVNAFLAAEDSTFFKHGGINYFAILRAFFANIKAGEKVQGASTITQQVARSLVLSNEKTYTRKIKEVLLAYKMEAHLSKEDILYLYLNQIFLGQKYYGVRVACDNYFNKPLKDITLSEAAILAGLPKAPSELNPIRSSHRAKERQRYVLKRMVEDGMITEDEYQKALEEPVKIYMKRNYWELAPHFLETVRLMLISKLGEEVVNDKGIRIYTSLDLTKQLEAQKQVQSGLRELDKREGYRGATQNVGDDIAAIVGILKETRDELLDKQATYKVMQPDGSFPPYPPLKLAGGDVPSQPTNSTTPAEVVAKPESEPVLPEYVKPGEIVKGVVTKIDDKWGLTYVRFAESVGLIDVESMKWARTPDPNVDARFATEITLPSKVLKKGDVIEIKVIDDEFRSSRITEKINEQKRKDKKKFTAPTDLPDFKKFAQLELEQEPLAEAGLLSIDQRTDDVIAMVGGYDYTRSQLNRTLQAARQTGSAFKTVVYTAALDHGYSPASAILDAPIVFEEEQEVAGSDSQETITKKWKPTNHSNKFVGDILFRNALIQSLNVPSVKIIEKIGVSLAEDYARRLGVFSPLNNDFTLALGSSSVTLYEMTKMFSQIGKLGRRTKPVIVRKVEDSSGKEILGTVYLDERFDAQIKPIEEEYEQRRQNYLAYQKALESGKDFKPIVTPTPQNGAVAPSGATDVQAAKVHSPDKEPPLFFKDPDQLIKPETAYVITSLLQGVVDEDGGTGARARSLGRPTAGKTGTTNEYYDAWFLGYTTNIATGVWVGYDQEKTLGKGEVGGRAALPIWVEYMRFAHEGTPAKNFNVPENIVFASIDNETGRLASASSKEVVRQAFVSGTEPSQLQDERGAEKEEQQEFYKEDLSN